jgi:hypothetical protein
MLRVQSETGMVRVSLEVRAIGAKKDENSGRFGVSLGRGVKDVGMRSYGGRAP